MDELKEKVILVTGAGRGLGAATVRVLAMEGATIIAADLNEQAVKGVAAGLQEEGLRVIPEAFDLCDDAQAESLVRRVSESQGRLDALINNAGIDVTLPVDEISVEDWDRVLQVNLRGPFLLSRAAFPIMREAGAGQIVNICSTASKRGWANASAYHASKWGLLGLSHGLHVEGRQWNIKVTAVVAGGMRTPFLLDRFPDLDPNRLQDPHNVAEVIRFVLTQPESTVIPEVTVLPLTETSWP
ncbi:MAG: SDR family oxidoreductase [Actinomycetota bacterium]|nr:SDR family oxidoreductase [Actinomycetota bacterium]